MATDQFTRQANQEIRLNPGDFNSDGVLQHNLTTPMSGEWKCVGSVPATK